ncbi:hypothetical protein GCM10008986_16970 [Salinibacillus aidingensis]|uniref:Uncharacterized protein n=1 Tax=Salinibacillus aidingensis TaxID=237684 RepID=A0ABN1B6U2_9BACI
MNKEKAMYYFKSKWVWAIAGAFLLIVISSSFFYLQGKSVSVAKVDEKMVTYDELVEEIDIKQSKLNAIETTIDEKTKERDQISDELEDNQEKYDRLNKIAKNEEEIQTKIEEKKDELTQLKADIVSNKNKLQELQGGVEEAKGEPIKLGAGHYTVGDDLPPGRYKIEPTQGSGNVFIDGWDGSSKLSETLGPNPDYHIPSYVFNAEVDDTMEINVPVKFTPVE